MGQRRREPARTNVPPPDGDLGADILRIAYESHFKLAQHYSAIIFQARIAITTVIVVAIGLGFDILASARPTQIWWLGVPGRGLTVYAAALLINLLHAMEVSYLKRFYQIIHGGKAIERNYNARSYFSSYDRPESWPLHIAYLAGVGVLVGVFLGAAWRRDQSLARSVVVLIAGGIPFVGYALSIIRLRDYVTKLLTQE